MSLHIMLYHILFIFPGYYSVASLKTPFICLLETKLNGASGPNFSVFNDPWSIDDDQMSISTFNLSSTDVPMS